MSWCPRRIFYEFDNDTCDKSNLHRNVILESLEAGEEYLPHISCITCLSLFVGKLNFSTVMFRPVTDYNEIANHFLECIYAHSCNARLQVLLKLLVTLLSMICQMLFACTGNFYCLFILFNGEILLWSYIFLVTQTGVLTPASSSSTLSTPSNGNQKATSNQVSKYKNSGFIYLFIFISKFKYLMLVSTFPIQFSQEYNLDGLNNIDKLVIEYLERPSST